MDISPSIDERAESLCSGCQSLNLRRFLVESEDPGSIELGGFQEILQRKSCIFCRLIIQALSSHSGEYWQEKIYPVEKCYLRRIQGISGTSRLITWFTATSSTLPPGISGHITKYGEILLLEQSSDIRQDLQVGLARLVDKSYVDFSLIRGWISSCEQHHGLICNLESYTPTYIRLLDLKHMRLVSGDQKYRYFALSYVWGNTATFRTLKSNISELEENSSILRIRDQLPRAINDAISLVSALQERYLWVDTLCIVQDDADDKRTHIPHMDVIYSQAAATIVALCGKDASVGLPGVRRDSRPVRQFSVTVSPWQLFAKLPELSFVLQKSRWATRAWTFQEGILSKRCLFFSEHQVFFQCRSSYCTEDSHGDQTRHDWGNGFTNPFVQNVTKSDDAYSPAFNVYNNLVKSYAGRQLTYHSDSLNAFQGILSLFSASHGWHFISALPENVFDLSLLWTPMFTAYLRPRDPSVRPSNTVCRTPTWCWTSWTGYVYWNSWRTDSYAGNAVSLSSVIDQFIIASPDGFRSIRRAKGNTDDELLQEFHTEAKNYINEHETGWNTSNGETENSSEMVLLFKASAVDLSHLSIGSVCDQCGNDQKRSHWFQRHSRSDSWIYDNDGRHCGTIYGLDPTWTDFHKPHLCELILLSYFDQDEVTQTNIDMHRPFLPPEYPSSDDYYSQVFDTSHYKYTRCWAYNIMLVEWRENFAMRVGVGQIHVDAWAIAGSSTKMIAMM